METIYFNGIPCHTAGTLPEVGTKAACYSFVTPELKEKSTAPIFTANAWF